MLFLKCNYVIVAFLIFYGCKPRSDIGLEAVVQGRIINPCEIRDVVDDYVDRVIKKERKKDVVGEKIYSLASAEYDWGNYEASLRQVERYLERYPEKDFFYTILMLMTYQNTNEFNENLNPTHVSSEEIFDVFFVVENDGKYSLNEEPVMPDFELLLSALYRPFGEDYLGHGTFCRIVDVLVAKSKSDKNLQEVLDFFLEASEQVYRAQFVHDPYYSTTPYTLYKFLKKSRELNAKEVEARISEIGCELLGSKLQGGASINTLERAFFNSIQCSYEVPSYE